MGEEDKAINERVFKGFDANGDGQISSSELSDALQKVGSITPQEIAKMMADIDTDGDGLISHEEFLQFAAANRDLIKDIAKIF